MRTKRSGIESTIAAIIAAIILYSKVNLPIRKRTGEFVVGKAVYFRDFGFLFLSAFVHFTAAFFSVLSKSWYNKTMIYCAFGFWLLQVSTHARKISSRNDLNFSMVFKKWPKQLFYFFLFTSFALAPFVCLFDMRLTPHEGALSLTFLILSVLPFRYGFNNFFVARVELEESAVKIDFDQAA